MAVEFVDGAEVEAERCWPVDRDDHGALSVEERRENRVARQAFLLGVKWARKNG